MGKTRVAGASMQDLRKVGVAGVEVVEALYESLADAARIVLAHTHSAATQVAYHKYGPAAAQATDTSMQLMHSVVETGLNVSKLRPTALVKKAIKGTAKNVVLGPRDQLQTPERLYQQSQYTQERPALQEGYYHVPEPTEASSGVAVAASLLPLPGNGINNSIFAAMPPLPSRAPMAAVSTTENNAGPQHNAAAGVIGVYSGRDMTPAIGTVVDGLPVTGPVLGQVVTFENNAPSAEVLQPSTVMAAPGTDQGLPYPTVSNSHYTARYYPAVPRA
ncbi:hypothetical protein VOLCADRAFT_107694 [Volvox carteri f. nagariensis]|uniref:Senescence domain-containing protein n=1 Tax=Volvox carteri f. nagariensis TaxID=3068 RepID=D8UFP8_VOLCA|nr:uncharacterized protein VOLCADRAFT_107694 [Volvox carteri f. nagariensis]EFJ41415.1 hypothetical protein VOLCADRAFT_107694 [Volvox carteri f. nagariensis]|eukprot:XP_002957521.1 hypothetical protein VOLCADRAFT_107694 [Volvox carteri f. nagariensis]